MTMQRSMLFLPFLLAACSGTMQNASQYMRGECMTRDTFEQVFACTKNRMYNDPLSAISPNPAENAEVNAYGEQLSSQLRQHQITDAQAKQAFAQEIAAVKARHQPAPAPVQ